VRSPTTNARCVSRRAPVTTQQREREAVEHRQQFVRQAFDRAVPALVHLLLLPATDVGRVGQRALQLLLELVALLLEARELLIVRRHLDRAFAVLRLVGRALFVGFAHGSGWVLGH
jgi:hypothetical protein